MKNIFLAVCGLPVIFSFAASAQELVSHEAVYDIALASTKGGAAGVVSAYGKMKYSIQKVCDQWQTESVFSLDVGYEMAGPDTTNWKQTTRESADGCLFEFDVFVREKGTDRKDLSGKAVCEGTKKKLSLSLPVRSEAVFPGSVVFPVQQTLRLIKAAQAGRKNVSSYVYDGTRPEALYSMNAVISAPENVPSLKAQVAADLIAGRKAYRFDAAFFEEFSSGHQQDGTPQYEVSMLYYDNGISDQIEQDFGSHRLRSTLAAVKKLPEIPCASKKKRQALTMR
ncbi:MAG: DUF1849 family protein [Alphaproteobacteria bacterium]|nr:DUF1849 family protein [Alphaproteobacteria bacterium]